MSKKEEIYPYVEKLGWVIHPIYNKVPSTKGWNKPETITKENCMNLMNSHCNIGLLCGKKSGVIVLDIDVLTPEEDRNKLVCGKEEWERLVKIHNEPLTVKSSTERGFHLFFKYDERIKSGNRCRETKDGKKIKWDLFSDKVVASTKELGSSTVTIPHPNKKENKYEWIRSPFEYPILPFPDWLLELLPKNEIIKKINLTPLKIIRVPVPPRHV